jgi:general secretion pathway protein C
MDGIMKKKSNSLLIELFIVLVVFLTVKLVWVGIELFLLPKSGINHISQIKIKPLYYHVSFIKGHNSKKPTIKKPIANIKDIKLVAIYSDFGNVVATIVYQHKTKVIAKGDVINGFKLIDGTNNYAIFSKNNKVYKVDLQTKPLDIKNRITVVKNNVNNYVNNSDDSIVDAGDYKIIDRGLFEHFATNMDDIYKNIGIKESNKDNKKVFQISFIKRGSPFAKLGLKRGDIIKSINGQEIDSYMAAFSAYKNIKDAEGLNMVIIRNNKQMELNYEIN